MWKLPAAVVVVFGLFSAPAHALELKNVSSVYGLFGAVRPDNKILPGDVLRLTFDIAGVKVEEKTGTAKYHITMELRGSKGDLVFSQNKTNEVSLSLGGNTLPGFAEVLIGTDQAPGKYTLKVTVTDLLAKDTKDISHGFDIQADFGFVRVYAPVASLAGLNYVANYAVAGMARDAKKKPSVSIRMRVLDDAGKPVHAQPFLMEIPKDLPEELLSKIETLPFIELQFPVFLNRAGQFIIEVEGTDNISKKTAKLRFPLKVPDPGTYSGK